ncbi:MAG: fatty acid desaturase family protein [Hyphomonas sp.]|nr:fatty acid desaturase family protein [Hyphomonas sp.]MCB9960704.1 fatty acid desaturase family protein [Hyphomonas sp.]MCB9971947.1 fatty acid desaturase family protein [Hyphomonas sp.]
MAAAARVRPLDLFSREEWERLSARNDWMGPLLVLHAWAVIAGAIALAIWQPFLIPLSVMLVGARQLGLSILMHDAAHGALHSNRAVNDFLGQWLCGAPVGAHLVNYRNYHLQHHKFAQQPEDPDLGLSAPFPITRASLRRKIVRDLTGQTYFKQRRNQFANAFGIGIKPGPGAANRMQGAREAVFPMIGTNLVLFAILAASGHWWAYFVLWLLPMATWMMMITRIRNIAEHAVVPDNADPMRHARTTLANPLEGLLLAPYWVNYHCEHHMFMHVPCYRLGVAHRALARKGITDRMEVRHGYLCVLRMAASKPDAVAVPA